MSRPPEPPSRPWWLVPVIVVLAVLGVVFLVRLIIGFVAGIFTFLVVIAVIVGGIYLFAKKD